MTERQTIKPIVRQAKDRKTDKKIIDKQTNYRLIDKQTMDIQIFRLTNI